MQQGFDEELEHLMIQSFREIQWPKTINNHKPIQIIKDKVYSDALIS